MLLVGYKAICDQLTGIVTIALGLLVVLESSKSIWVIVKDTLLEKSPFAIQ